MNFKIIYIYKEAVCIDVCFKSTEIKDGKKKKKDIVEILPNHNTEFIQTCLTL